jgi:hypothetical protein
MEGLKKKMMKKSVKKNAVTARMWRKSSNGTHQETKNNLEHCAFTWHLALPNSIEMRNITTSRPPVLTP